jgi:hypothetical protein
MNHDHRTADASTSIAARIGAQADAHYERERAEDQARARRRIARDDGTADLAAFREKWRAHVSTGASQIAGLFRWIERTSQLCEERVEIANRIEADGGAPIAGILSEQVEAVYAAALAAGAAEAGLAGNEFDDGLAALHEGLRIFEETMLRVRAVLRRVAHSPSIVQIRQRAESV